MADVLPAEVVHRPKQGFRVPLSAWLAGPLSKWAEERLFSRKARELDFLDFGYIEHLWRRHRTGKQTRASTCGASSIFSAGMSTGSPNTVLHVVDGLGLSGKTRNLVSVVSQLDRRRFAPVVCRLNAEGARSLDNSKRRECPLHHRAAGKVILEQCCGWPGSPGR